LAILCLRFVYTLKAIVRGKTMDIPFRQDLWCTHYAWPSSTVDGTTVQQEPKRAKQLCLLCL
jgi:hypothetical protein